MESSIVHEQLNNSNATDARRTLICYLQYLVAYRRDVPDVEEHVIYELQRLLTTAYVKRLKEDDVIHQILQLAEELELASKQRSKIIWTTLSRNISSLE